MDTQAVRWRLPPVVWARSTRFDLVLLLGTTLLAVPMGFLAASGERALSIILLLDLTLLSYPHVFATFTRLSFDGPPDSVRRLKLVVFGTPFLLVGGVTSLWVWRGPAAVLTVYFFWQWFHYTRQSYGLERIYWRKARGPGARAGLNAALPYAFAVWGLLHRSARGGTFAGNELYWPPVPPGMATAAGVVAGVLLLVWTARRVEDLRRGELRLGHALYVLSHVAIFAVAYLIIPDVTAGWITINIWHNAQYLLIVALFNANRFKDGVDPAHPLLSRLSQPDSALRMFVLLLVASSAAYAAITSVGALTAAIPVALIVTQTVNFHHYVVDSVIWKLRKPPVRATLGIAS